MFALTLNQLSIDGFTPYRTIVFDVLLPAISMYLLPRIYPVYPAAPVTALKLSCTESGQAQSTTIPVGKPMMANEESDSSLNPLREIRTLTSPEIEFGIFHVNCCNV